MRASVFLLLVLLVAAPWVQADPQKAAPSQAEPVQTAPAENAPAHAAPTQTTPPEAAAPEAEPPVESDRPDTAMAWSDRVDEMIADVDAGKRPRSDANQLYDELDEVLRQLVNEHRGAFRAADSTLDPIEASDTESSLKWGSTVGELWSSLDILYRARLRLLRSVTRDYHALLTGNGVPGVEQIQLELDYLSRKYHYQRVAIPDGSRLLVRRLRTAPVPTVLGGLTIIFAIAVFRGWRHWAKTGLPRMIEFTRRTWYHHVLARPFSGFLRYVERVRRPLEWIALFYVIFRVTEVPEVHEIDGVVRIVVFTMLMAWFSVSLADAFATRPSRYAFLRTEQRDKVRLHTLWIVAAWALILVMGMRLALHLVGRGTLHAWVGHLFILLAIPVVVLILLVWRPVIRRHLEREAHFSIWVEKLLKRRGKLGELASIVGGMAYLLTLRARRLGLKLVRRTNLGRTLVAEALRQSMIRANAEDTEIPELDADLRKRWLRGEAAVESAITEDLKNVCDMLQRGWRTVVLIGERGAGKSFFVNRLVEDELEGNAVLVSTPHGGAEQAHLALGRALELEGSPTGEEVAAAAKERGVRLIVWDDMHRLCSPILDGQDELNRVVEALEDVEGLTMVATVDAAAWEYIARVREGTLTNAAIVRLSGWSEAQIGELLETRAREVGMELDYADLTFPRILLEEEFDSPEEGLRASYRRILWAEADGNPEIALRLIVDHLVEKEDGDGLLRLPRTRAASELGPMTLVQLLVLRFLIRTDGASVEELVAGLRYPEAMMESVLIASEMRGLLEENHGRYRVAWRWYRTVTRMLARRNMLGAAQIKDDRTVPGRPLPRTSPRVGRADWRVAR